MMTPGGEHSEVDIPPTIEKVKKDHKNIEIIYAWLFTLSNVADFLTSQVLYVLIKNN